MENIVWLCHKKINHMNQNLFKAMSNALGFRREISLNVMRQPEVVVSQTPCSGPPQLNHSHVWKHFLCLVWTFYFIVGISIFSMPTEILEAVTTLDVTDQLAVNGTTCSLLNIDSSVPKETTTLFTRTISVLTLLVASGIPCAWDVWSRGLSFLSMLVATIYWIVILADDEFEKIEEWFGITFLVLLVCPLILLLVDTVLKVVERLKQ